MLDPPTAANDETLETVQRRLHAGGAVIATFDDEPAGVAFYEPDAENI